MASMGAENTTEERDRDIDRDKADDSEATNETQPSSNSNPSPNRKKLEVDTDTNTNTNTGTDTGAYTADPPIKDDESKVESIDIGNPSQQQLRQLHQLQLQQQRTTSSLTALTQSPRCQLDIDQKIGYCFDQFRCKHNYFTGILYVGPLGVVFLGKFLLFEWTVALRWEEVTRVKRLATATATTNSSSNENNFRGKAAIRIETQTQSRDTNNTDTHGVYDFEGFFDSQKAYETLMGLHNDSVYDNTPIDSNNNGKTNSNSNSNSKSTTISTVTPRGSFLVPNYISPRVPLRRTNSSPAEPMSTLFDFDDPPEGVNNINNNTNSYIRETNNSANKATLEDFRNQYSTTRNKPTLQKSTSINKLALQRSTSMDAPTRQVIARDIETSTVQSNSHNKSSSSPPRSGGGNGNADTNTNTITTATQDSAIEVEVEVELEKSFLPNPSSGMPELDSGLSEDQLSAEWAKVCSDIEKYPEAPVRDLELELELPPSPETATPSALDAFVATFVANDAPFSWIRFMTTVVGDKDIRATTWEVVGEDSDHLHHDKVRALTRTIDFTHPVALASVPMAPNEAKAHKEQTLKHYGNRRGLVLETKTFVRDVPMTDCFYVKDVVQVEAVGNNNDKNKLRLVVNVRFEVVFVKSTLFRGLIAGTTKSETKKLMTDLADYLSRNMNRGTLVASRPTKDPSPSLASPSPKSGLSDAIVQPNDELTPTISHDNKSKITSNSNSNNNNKSSSSSSNNNRNYLALRFLVGALLLWMARKQARVWNETQSLRLEFEGWKTLALSELEAAHTETRTLRDELRRSDTALGKLRQETSQHATEIRSLRDDFDAEVELRLRSDSNFDSEEWTTAFETARQETQSLREELRVVRSALSELEAIATAPKKCPSRCCSSSSEPRIISPGTDDSGQEGGIGRPRGGVPLSIGRPRVPLSMEPVQDRNLRGRTFPPQSGRDEL